MRLYDHSHIVIPPRQNETAWWFHPWTVLPRIRQFLAVRRRRAREIRELHGLSDRELQDLGLSRADFDAIEKGVYRRG